jgi:hypothetical protein
VPDGAWRWMLGERSARVRRKQRNEEEVRKLAIEIRIEGGEACPRVVCDVCREPIEEAGAGNMLWNKDDHKCLWFTHKVCYQTFAAQRGRPTSWQPLEAFMCYLLRNTGYEPARAERSAQMMSPRV